jgi:hypothetical protein
MLVDVALGSRAHKDPKLLVLRCFDRPCPILGLTILDKGWVAPVWAACDHDRSRREISVTSGWIVANITFRWGIDRRNREPDDLETIRRETHPIGNGRLMSDGFVLIVADRGPIVVMADNALCGFIDGVFFSLGDCVIVLN